MLYNDLLRHGHWEAFIDYLWLHTDCAKRLAQPSPAVWAQSVAKAEDEHLKALFEGKEEVLFKQLSHYFDHLAKQYPKGHCLRCNRRFALQEAQDCQLCGWDFASVPRDKVSAAIELNEYLNAQYIEKQVSYIQANAHFERMDREAKWWSAECKRMESEEVLLRKDLKARQTEKAKRAELEQKLQMQEEQIKELELMLKNAESLFLPDTGQQSEQSISLSFKGHILHAVVRPLIKFPIDLIMGVQKITDGCSAKTINKTCSFVFIHEDQWTPLNKHEWKVDLFEIAKGKISGNFHINCFSHLHKKDCLTDIRYDIKRLTFI
ncbi:MAG: hypothetical protein CV087_19705 [Candidatus Brocadia sp. WS118]|nr:MAG: hypothetical protein CV087_19705 [Candidatus Brocadia sp. WS118]